MIMTDAQQKFSIRRLYIKDLSFESPRGPDALIQQWQPDLHLDIHIETHPQQAHQYEVVLALTVTVKSQDKVAFVVDVKQCGVFYMDGFVADDLQRTLNIFCPNTLYPYAREVVTDLVSRSGFPQLILAPINFDALYQQRLQNQSAP